MNIEQLQQLADIYNQLLQVKVDGQSAFHLVDAERALFKFIKAQEQELMTQQKNNKEE